MVEKAPVFEKTIHDYLRQIARIKTKEKFGSSLFITVTPDGFKIPYFHRPYVITSDSVVDADGNAASHAVSVILCKYLLLYPDLPSQDNSLVTYKDFRDAAPYAGGFHNTAERPIAKIFEGALPELERRCLELGGTAFDTGVSCELSVRFEALPHIPIFLLFNDADEDFPAQATLLFQKNAASYLDMECLAMIGSSLAYRLAGN